MWEVRVIELGVRGRLWEGAQEESWCRKSVPAVYFSLSQGKKNGAWISRKS